MSLIIDALEKAQRDKESREGKFSDSSILHGYKKKRKKRISSIILLSFFSLILLGTLVWFFYWRYKYIVIPSNAKVSNISKSSINNVVKSAASNVNSMRSKSKIPSETYNEGPVFVKELDLPNGLHLKVDGVYKDGGTFYAMIGPYIVKKGDVIEDVVKINYINFVKVGVEYENKKYFLLVD